MALAHHFRTKGKGMERNDELSACKEQLVGPASNPTLVQRYAFSLCFGLFIYLLTKGHEHWPLPLKRRETTNEGQPQGVVYG